MVDLCIDLSGPNQRYLAELPVDPDSSGSFNYEADCSTLNDYNTSYFIFRTANNRVTVTAPNAEDPGDGAPTISITR